MGSKIIGIEIGSDTAKLVVCSSGQVHTMAVERLPENLVHEGRITAPDAMSGFLKEMRAKYRLPGGTAALVLPPRAVIAHSLTLPMMTAQELSLNLPFEFRDFVGQDGSKYQYDYALMSIPEEAGGDPQRLDLFAAAVKKELIDEYYAMFKHAGFTLKIAIPSEMAWLNLVRRAQHEPNELCIVDIGHVSTHVYIYADGRFIMGKEIEIGGQQLDEAIASETKVDSHLARTYKESNLNNVLSMECCASIYNALAVEIMKAVNFYGYDSPQSNLQDLYYCGGPSQIEPLRLAILKNTGLTMHHINRLVPGVDETDDSVLCCALAAGAAVQQQ